MEGQVFEHCFYKTTKHYSKVDNVFHGRIENICNADLIAFHVEYEDEKEFENVFKEVVEHYMTICKELLPRRKQNIFELFVIKLFCGIFVSENKFESRILRTTSYFLFFNKIKLFKTTICHHRPIFNSIPK